MTQEQGDIRRDVAPLRPGIRQGLGQRDTLGIHPLQVGQVEGQRGKNTSTAITVHILL
jgi:hypothetical protein